MTIYLLKNLVRGTIVSLILASIWIMHLYYLMNKNLEALLQIFQKAFVASPNLCCMYPVLQSHGAHHQRAPCTAANGNAVIIRDG
jgi:hypothetical protein